MNRNIQLQKIVLTAIFTALVFVVTVIIAIPIPATKGYINFGDGIIIIASLILGPIYGGIVGGVGSCLADFVLAPQWAIFTFLIKFLEGVAVGLIYQKNGKTFNRIIAILSGVLVMIAGYFLAATMLYDIKIAMIELLNNLIQGSVSFIFAYSISEIFIRRKIKIK